jgi:hypothetical protein
MNIKNVKLADLKPVDKFLLSFPLRPELYYELREKFAHIPFIIVNKEDEIIFGIDYYRLLESRMIPETAVLQVNISEKDALILNYNLKEKFTWLNLYEKLVFVKKITPLAGEAEIYQKTGLDITINPELLEKLDLLLSTAFRDALIHEHISLKSGLKLCVFQPEGCDVLLALFGRVSFSTSHQLKILEMTEEILFRDKCCLEDIFEKLGISEYLDLEKPQKKIIDELFKYRYPIYNEAEEKWQEEIKNLRLPDKMKVTHYPFFEKKQIELTIQLQDAEELRKLIEKLEGKKSNTKEMLVKKEV